MYVIDVVKCPRKPSLALPRVPDRPLASSPAPLRSPHTTQISNINAGCAHFSLGFTAALALDGFNFRRTTLGPPLAPALSRFSASSSTELFFSCPTSANSSASSASASESSLELASEASSRSSSLASSSTIQTVDADARASRCPARAPSANERMPDSSHFPSLDAPRALLWSTSTHPSHARNDALHSSPRVRVRARARARAKRPSRARARRAHRGPAFDDGRLRRVSNLHEGGGAEDFAG